MLLSKANFVDEEKNAALLNMNQDDYLRKQVQPNIAKFGDKWKDIMETSKSANAPRENVAIMETPRIIYLDAERTFAQPHHRTQLIQFLTRVMSHLKGDYAQALSYVSGFLLLVLDEDTVLDIVLRLNKEDKYVPGYWKEEAVAAATDAYVFRHMMEHFFPKVATHLAKLNLFPENYCQKWFVGLCTQILPFEALYPFFDNFLTHGYTYLFQFGLSLIDMLQDELLAANDFASVFALLRLYPTKGIITNSPPKNTKLKNIDPVKLINHALDFEVYDFDYPKLRKDLFEKHLKERLAQAKAYAEQAKKEADDSDDDDEEGEDCEICHEMIPELQCAECDLKICEECHEKSKGGKHKSSHKVTPYEPADEDDEEVNKLTSEVKKL